MPIEAWESAKRAAASMSRTDMFHVKTSPGPADTAPRPCVIPSISAEPSEAGRVKETSVRFVPEKSKGKNR